jgi:hypothetical protein
MHAHVGGIIYKVVIFVVRGIVRRGPPSKNI